MSILLTGGTGYIGSHTAVELLNDGHEVVIVDNLSNSKPDVVDRIEKITGKRPIFIEADLLNESQLDKIFEENHFDAVIHFAGLKAVGESVKNPLEYYHNNIVSSVNLLKAMKKYKIKSIIFSSSATVYGEPGVVQYTEDLPTGQNISNPYGKTKYMIEEILKDAQAADPDMNVTLLRYFNPIGAHDSGLIGENPNGIPNNLLPYVAKVATGELPKVDVFGGDYDTPDGTCIRDYIHVVDLAKGHLVALEKLNGLSIYNLGSGKGSSVLEVMAAFSKASGKDIPYEIVGRRAGDLPECFADPTKANRELGWKAERTLDEACSDTWHWQNGRVN